MTPRGVPTRRAPPSSPLGTRSARTFVTKAAGTKPEHVLSAGSATFPPVTSTTSHPWWTDKRGPVTGARPAWSMACAENFGLNPPTHTGIPAAHRHNHGLGISRLMRTSG
jgi:hypothetical protein